MKGIDLSLLRQQAEQVIDGITPGPWQAEIHGRDDGHMCRITTAWAKDGCFLQVGETWNPHHGASYVGLSRAECIANARLMAAAPELIRQLLNALVSLTAREREWAESVDKILDGFDKGVFVRDVKDDDKPGWSIRLLDYAQALRKAQELIADSRSPVSSSDTA